MKKNRIVAFALACMFLVGCATTDTPQPTSQTSEDTEIIQEEEELQQSESVISISWNMDDTLNSFTCTTIPNLYLSGLLADPLLAQTEMGEFEYRLALEIDSQALRCSIKLQDNLFFDSGEKLTSADVVASIEAAQQSPNYAATLDNIAQVSATDDYTVVITLNTPDVYFERNLVFPIYKEGTETLEVPEGIGRFRYNESSNTLTVNNSYATDSQSIEQIRLVDIPEVQDSAFALMEGKLDFFYSDLQNDFVYSTGASVKQVTLSNLVYMAVNESLFNYNELVRESLYVLMPRADIASRVYENYATPADIPINPILRTTVPEKVDKISPQQQLAVLEENGWRLNSNNILSGSGTLLDFVLIVNEENPYHVECAEVIQETYAEAGIGIQIQALSFAEYERRVLMGEYQLYIGEVKTPANLDLQELIFPQSLYNSKTHESQELYDIYWQVKDGTLPQSALEEKLVEEKVILPIVYRRGTINYSRNLSANIQATEQDIYHNIMLW